MREIKFRAWDLERKKMCIVFHMDFVSGFHIRVSDDEGWHRPLERFELMQFTGLLDKNGKEIYEGDILNQDQNPDDSVQSYFARVEIKFGEYDDSGIEYGSPGYGWYVTGYYGYKRIGGKLDFYETEESILEYRDLEVIGNIYENPELLNTK